MYFVKQEKVKLKINISKEDLAWNSDKKYKFLNPKEFKNTIKPPNWKQNVTYLEDGYNNNDLIVWMRTAAFSEFRKLYGRIILSENYELWRYSNHSNDLVFGKNSTFFSQSRQLPEGQYYVEIDYRK